MGERLVKTLPPAETIFTCANHMIHLTWTTVKLHFISPTKKLSKADEDKKDRLEELLTAARERMVCLRAAKKKHKNVPCWDACQTLIDDLKAQPGVLFFITWTGFFAWESNKNIAYIIEEGITVGKRMNSTLFQVALFNSKLRTQTENRD